MLGTVVDTWNIQQQIRNMVPMHTEYTTTAASGYALCMHISLHTHTSTLLR